MTSFFRFDPSTALAGAPSSPYHGALRTAVAGLALAVAGVPAGAGRIEEILRSDPRLAPYAEAAEEHRLQVLLGWIEEDEDQRQILRQEGFRASAEYFYPASAIKLFAAVAALETLGDLRRETGLAVDENTPLLFHPLFDGEELTDADPSNRDGGRITVGHEIKKLFLVSDNVAFNRLYELVGPDALNRSARRAGIGSARIVHRLSIARTAEENRRVPKIELVGDGFRHTVPERSCEAEPPVPEIAGLAVGRAYLRGGERIDQAMDFRVKNRISLADLQRALALVVRPGVDVGEGDGFRLTERQRALLLDAMAGYPRQSENPVYDPEEYPDHWVKFLLPGLRRVVPDERLRIYNKVGRAYGFSIENAFVVDRETGRSFFLAATVYTNRDGVLNDDAYEYETAADPFLADLGEAVARALWELD